MRAGHMIQLLPRRWASVYCEDAFTPASGWLDDMLFASSEKSACLIGVCVLWGLTLGVVSSPLFHEKFATQAEPLTAQSSAQDPPGSASSASLRASQEVQLGGDSSWLDTGIDVRAGEHVFVTATGTIRYANQRAEATPAGFPRGFKDLLLNLPDNDAGRGAVIGRIGDKDTSQPFLIGDKRDLVSPVSGRLSVAINQLSSDGGDGTYTVEIKIYAANANPVLFVSKNVASLPGIDDKLFSQIPRRVADPAGDPGDMVNFLILGSQAELEKVFTTAGWVQVDADVKATLLHGILESISKESYLTMPMSPLYLFGRQQDYGWAHAEPISVVALRNHLRIWKAPFEVHGRTLWVGAATHDVGFEKDQRNNGLTHKIDPNIDLERDYVEKTLSSTGLVAEVARFTPRNPMTEAKTATGGSFHSNGQVVILELGKTTDK